MLPAQVLDSGGAQVHYPDRRQLGLRTGVAMRGNEGRR